MGSALSAGCDVVTAGVCAPANPWIVTGSALAFGACGLYLTEKLEEALDASSGVTKSVAGTGSPPPDDDDDGFDDEPRKRGEKGQTFRGGKKAQRDNWYGQNDKDFQKWWHRDGKAEFNGGRDIQNSQNAKDAMQYWKDIGKPTPK